MDPFTKNEFFKLKIFVNRIDTTTDTINIINKMIQKKCSKEDIFHFINCAYSEEVELELQIFLL